MQKRKKKGLGRSRTESKKEGRVRRKDIRAVQFFLSHYILETGNISLGSTEKTERVL